MRSTLGRVAGYLFAICVVLAGWQLTALLVNSPALPTPLASWQVLQQNLPGLLPAFGTSLYRTVLGLLIGALPAVPLGIALGRSERLDAVCGPILYLLYPVPKIVFLPVLLVLLGLADAPKIALIALTVLFQVLMSVRDAACQVPAQIILSARSLGAGRLQMLRHVILPAVMPDLFTALRIGSGTAVAVLFLAESFAGSTGLGYFIVDAWGMINYPRMFAGIIAMAILGVLIYAVIDLVEKRVTAWRRRG